MYDSIEQSVSCMFYVKLDCNTSFRQVRKEEPYFYRHLSGQNSNILNGVFSLIKPMEMYEVSRYKILNWLTE